MITSTESASSIDTQFQAMCGELNQRCDALNIILDEKKCGNMKSTIDHIKTKLKVAMCLSTADEMNNEKVTDPKNLRPLKQLPPSSDEESEDEASELDPHKY